jgi:aminoglycoside phosphotransferase (APT) family kinase protein
VDRALAIILKRLFPDRELVSFELLSGGASNLNYLLRFDRGEAPLVLRIYTRDPLACRKEVDLLQAASRILPVPEIVYACPEGEEHIGPHVLYRFAEGITFQELKSKGNRQDMASAAYAIGEALARVQQVAPPESLSSEQDLTGDWQDSPVIEKRTGPEDRDRLCDFVSRWSPRVSQLYKERSLVHGDFNNRNAIVKKEGDSWIVTGILDWELALVGSPLWDAARFICYERLDRPCREPHFSQGFRDGGGKLPQDWNHFCRVVNLVSAAQSLSRPDLPEHFAGELRDLIVAILDSGTDTKH